MCVDFVSCYFAELHSILDGFITPRMFFLWQIVSKLKEEIILIEKERTELQLHMARTDWWCENLGMWKASITSGEVGLSAFLPSLLGIYFQSFKFDFIRQDFVPNN